MKQLHILIIIFASSCMPKITTKGPPDNLDERETSQISNMKKNSDSQLSISQTSMDYLASAENFPEETLIILNKKMAQKLFKENSGIQIHSKEEALKLVREENGHWIFATKDEPVAYGLTETRDWDWNTIALITASTLAGTVIAGGVYRKFQSSAFPTHSELIPDISIKTPDINTPVKKTQVLDTLQDEISSGNIFVATPHSPQFRNSSQGIDYDHWEVLDGYRSGNKSTEIDYDHWEALDGYRSDTRSTGIDYDHWDALDGYSSRNYTSGYDDFPWD